MTCYYNDMELFFKKYFYKKMSLENHKSLEDTPWMYYSSMDTLKAFNDFENKQKSVCSNVSWYVKVWIFWKCIQYTIYWDKTQMLKKNYFGQNRWYKKCPFCLSQAPTHHSFTFNLLFLYELKHMVRLSKTVCAIFHFRFRSVFIKDYIFVQQNVWTLCL